MKSPLPPLPVTAVTLLLAGCAAGYSPPPDRRGAERCPRPEVLVCEDHYPSRLESENRPEPICRCQDPTRIH